MNITEISKHINEAAHAKGFWADGVNVGEKLMLTVSELSEALEAHRKGKWANVDAFHAQLNEHNDFKKSFEAIIKDTVNDELADAIIRLLDLACQLDIDIEWHIANKLAYNSLRPYKHGKAY